MKKNKSKDSEKPLRSQFYMEDEKRADKFQTITERAGCASGSELLRRVVDVIHDRPEEFPEFIGGTKK